MEIRDQITNVMMSMIKVIDSHNDCIRQNAHNPETIKNLCELMDTYIAGVSKDLADFQ